MSDEFIVQFVNSEIKTNGGNAEPLDVTAGKRRDSLATSISNTHSIMSYVKAILNKFLTQWTDTRAARIDNLDTNIASRASANTALNNTVWTDTRAARIDNLDTNIDTANTKIGTNTDNAGTTTIFARLKQIYDNMLKNTVWTDTRAGYLDTTISSRASQTTVDTINSRVDTTISSRAPASTAVSNEILTNTRIGYLDKLNTGVPTIKSNQYGTISVTLFPVPWQEIYDIDIATVNPAKCQVILNGQVVFNVETSNPNRRIINGPVLLSLSSNLLKVALYVTGMNDLMAINMWVQYQIIEYF